MPDHRRAAVVYDCISPLDRGGGERVYRRIAEVLVDRGYDTDYVTRVRWDGDPPSAPFHPVGVWRGEIYDDAGVRRTTAALAFAWRCFRYFRRHRHDYVIVIASALPVLTAIAVRLALIGSSTRVVADWLEIWSMSKWRSYAGPIGGTCAALLQWAGARLIREHTVNSSFTASRMRALRRDARVIVLGLVDLVDETSVSTAAAPPEVLFVGRLIEDKRAELIPEVIEHARGVVPGLRAHIVGDGPLRARVEAARLASPARDAIEILGHVDDERLAVLRSRAAVLLSPSVREGFGLAVAESAAAGVPVVVVRHPDNAAMDLVVPGINGEIADPDDVESLARAIVVVVRAGQGLRDSTLTWFREARRQRSLPASVDALLAPRD